MFFAHSGPHGTGKTTAALALAAELREKNARVMTITDVARSCPLPLSTPAAQRWIFCRRMALEIAARAALDAGEIDYAVADRTAVDTLGYLGDASGLYPWMFAALSWSGRGAAHVDIYDWIFWTPVSASRPYLVDDGVRDMDPEEQRRVQAAIRGAWQSMGVLGVWDENKLIRGENGRNKIVEYIGGCQSPGPAHGRAFSVDGRAG